MREGGRERVDEAKNNGQMNLSTWREREREGRRGGGEKKRVSEGRGGVRAEGRVS